MSPGSVTQVAPAKINLALHVVGRRADNYHELESLVVFTRFGDDVSVEASAVDSFVVSGPFANAVPDGSDNLIVKARDRLRAALGRGGPVAISLNKNLPVASGVGGGSSDAATALLALASLWQAQIPVIPIAEKLGADVPMCLAGQPLVARGIGHDIEPVAGFPELAMVLVNPGIAVSTPEIFSNLGSRHNMPLPPLPHFADFVTTLSWLKTTRNDLQDTATTLTPQIGAVLDALRNSGAAFMRMSGSGATCFGIFETEGAASRAAAAIARRQDSWLVVATTTAGSSD